MKNNGRFLNGDVCEFNEATMSRTETYEHGTGTDQARYTARYKHGTRTDQARYQARYKHGTRHGTSTEQARYQARYKHGTSMVPGMVQARNKHGANKKSVCGWREKDKNVSILRSNGFFVVE